MNPPASEGTPNFGHKRMQPAESKQGPDKHSIAAAHFLRKYAETDMPRLRLFWWKLSVKTSCSNPFCGFLPYGLYRFSRFSSQRSESGKTAAVYGEVEDAAT
jgi:hypothetical protein